ncbi:DUF4349 domain-containing protein [Rubrobacter marinus]|uniref:DUF4349 domain-containing protein n=1 Tax=Rubrobacter marinus TaxID=2653852 RepID=A0A6G8PXE9_9ACTN|nr:DUF4349 domain-containing protein [Rubrobacter marinus]
MCGAEGGRMPRIFPWFENDRCPAERALAPTPSTGLRASLDGNIAAYAWPIALTALLVFASAACGGAGGGGAQSSGSSAGQASPETDFAPTPGDEAASSAGAAASSAARQVEGGAEEGPRAALPGFDGEKIVKTAELEVRSEDVRGAASRAQEVAARFGGSVTSSRVDGGDDGVTADLVLSVPSPEFEAALEELRAWARLRPTPSAART